MDCDAGSSRGEGFRRGDSAPGLPRGFGFGSRAGGSGSLRSPFVDVDSPSLPMVDALSGARLGARHGGGPTARRRASRGGSAAALSGERLGDTASGAQRPERSAAAGPGARSAARGGCGFRPAFFRTRRGAFPAVSTELSALT